MSTQFLWYVLRNCASIRAQYFLEVTSDDGDGYKRDDLYNVRVSNFELNLKNLLGLQSHAT